MTGRRFRKIGLGGAIVAILAVVPAHAAFHLWDINEIYSNEDGTVQFIELFTTVGGQEFLANHTITASRAGETDRVFTFPTNSPAPTNDRHLLIATAAFAGLPGSVTPDFILPDGFLFTPNGSVNFTNQDIRNYENLPTDGVQSLNYPAGTIGTNSPTNFAGDAGSIDAGSDPTETPTETETETPTPTETPTETEVETETHTPTETADGTETETPTPTPTDEGGPEPTLEGDLNGDNVVDFQDLLILLLQWQELIEQ